MLYTQIMTHSLQMVLRMHTTWWKDAWRSSLIYMTAVTGQWQMTMTSL